MSEPSILTVFRDIIREFYAETDEYIERMIGYTAPQVQPSLFITSTILNGEDSIIYKQAVCYLTASKISISKSGNVIQGTGAVKKLQSSDAMVEYDVGTSVSAVGADAYYKKYLELLTSYGIPIPTQQEEVRHPAFVLIGAYEN